MSDKKENILNFIKLFLLISMMTMGFHYIYAVIWFAVGLPQTTWAVLLCAVLAGLSEYGYFKWIRG